MIKGSSKKIGLFLLLPVFLLVFNLFLISGQTNSSSGLEIVNSFSSTAQQGSNYTFVYFLINESTGIRVDNSSTTCIFYLDDNAGSTILIAPVNYVVYSGNIVARWEYEVDGIYLSSVGYRNYLINCMDNSNSSGGSIGGNLLLSPNGTSGNSTIALFIIVILLSYAIAFIGFFARNIPVTIIGGMSMMSLGVYLITQGLIIFRDSFTNGIAYVTIGIGAFFTLYAILEVLQESM